MLLHALESTAISKKLENEGTEMVFTRLPEVSISRERCLDLVLQGFFTVLTVVYEKNPKAGVAVFDAVLQFFMQAFKLDYERIVELCAPHGYEPLHLSCR